MRIRASKVPVELGADAPFVALTELAAHEQQLLAGEGHW
jgi:hypothetical protein